MAAQTSDTMTIRLNSETKAKLSELAIYTRRTKSFLAAEAISDYVERELAIVTGIERGIDDMNAGRVTSHDDVMAEIDDIINASERERATR